MQESDKAIEEVDMEEEGKEVEDVDSQPQIKRSPSVSSSPECRRVLTPPAISSIFWQVYQHASLYCSRWADLEEEVPEEEEAPRKKKKRKQGEAEAEPDSTTESKTGKVANRSSAASILKQVSRSESSLSCPPRGKPFVSHSAAL